MGAFSLIFILFRLQEIGKDDIGRVLRLIQSGADVNAEDADSGTPLHWAALSGHYDICKTLLENGAQINPESESNNWTPLRYAVYTNHQKIVRLLLENGANPNCGAGTWDTALEYTIENSRDANIVDLLIEH